MDKKRTDRQCKNRYEFLLVLQPPERCDQCRQLLNDSDLRLFKGDPDEAVSFFTFMSQLIAVTDTFLPSYSWKNFLF